MRGDDWVNPAIVAKYRATPQFIKEALKIIKPDPERERESVNPNLLQYFRGSRRRLEWTN